MTKRQKKMLIRILVSAVLLLAVNLACLFETENHLGLKNLFYGIPLAVIYGGIYVLIGGDILKKAFRGILNGRVFDENFLMALATLGAFALAVYEKSGDYNEAIFVMLFYQTGEFFQGYAVGKSRKSISALMDIRPDYANIEKDGKLVQVSPEDVAAGSEIIVQPGEKIPLDGIVVSGNSALNTTALTGESVPREVFEGCEVVSGSINLSGLLKIRTVKDFGESAVSKILELVENASSRKSKSEEFISKFARIYTPVVCFCALALSVLPPVILMISGNSPCWSVWVYRALTFLVISCPCALVISIPLSFFAGLGGASREGVLIKGSNFMETLSKTRIVVFDKTGTLTKGVFEVTGVHHNKLEEQKLLEYASLAECSSSHPISKSLQKAYGKEIDRSRVTDVEEISGLGITAVVDGIKVSVGNLKLMEKAGVKNASDCHKTGTIIHVALDGEYAGHIVISDVEKRNSREALKELKRAGVQKTVMLTGDSEKVAEAVSESLGLDEYRAELLPQDKVSEVEKLIQAKGKNEVLAFCGDGINDAPVLTRADIGIAMGAIGSDAAIEAADVVLMDDDPLKISRAIRISRKCIGIVRENIWFALTVKFACLCLGAFGIANMWLAIFADVGVMIIAVLNAIRALRYKK